MFVRLLCLLLAVSASHARTVTWDYPDTWDAATQWIEYQYGYGSTPDYSAGSGQTGGQSATFPDNPGATLYFRARTCNADECSDWATTTADEPADIAVALDLQRDDEPEPPVMPTFTLLTSGTVTSKPVVTASISPAANALIIVAVASAQSPGAPYTQSMDISGLGLDWSQSDIDYGYRRNIFAALAVTGASPGSGTITMDFTTSYTWLEAKYDVIQVTGVDTADPVGTIFTINDGNSHGSVLRLTVSETPGAGDVVFAAFGIEGASVSAALGSELDTTLNNSGGGGNVRTLVTAYDSAPDSTPNPGITWTGSYFSGGIAFIVHAAAGGGASIEAETGAYALTGQDAGLLHGSKLTANQGGYTLTGQAAGLSRDVRLTAEQGGYALTGQAGGLLRGLLLQAEQGSHTLTGQAAGLLRGLLLQAAQGAYTLTGQSAALLRGLQIAAGQGSYTLTGQDTGLLRALKIAAETDSYTLTGQAAGLLSSSQLAAEMGGYALTGQDIGLLRGLRLVAGQGSYALTGQNATLIAGQRLTAEAGVYVLTGQNAGLLRGLLLQAETGSYAATGQDAGLLRALLLQAEQGSYSLTGQDVGLLRSLRLAAEQGSYVLTGQDVGLRRWLLLAESGVYTLTGQAVVLDVGSTSAGELAATITIQPALSAIPDIMPAVTGRIALH